MNACNKTLSWNSEWACSRHGWLGGKCVEHFLDGLRWEWQRGTRWYATLDLSNLNRPYFQIDDDRPPRWAALSWGNGNSDPVWTVQVPLSRGVST